MSCARGSGVWLLVSALAAACGELRAQHDVPISSHIGPLSLDAWWNQPVWQEWLEQANPLAMPVIEREPHYVDPYGWQFLRDPYRLGFTKHDEIAFLPAVDANPAGDGTMQFAEFNSWLRYSHVAHPDWLTTLTGSFDGYRWNGPAQPSLPGQVGRISLDMEAVWLGPGPVNTTIGFHPQLVGSFADRVTNRAFNFDARIYNTHQVSPEFWFVYGLAVWDRVDLLFIPEVGVMWTPDDRWEFRLLFPRSQVSYRLGAIGAGQTWLTGAVEYVVQAYQVDLADEGRLDRIQLRDWRATLGVRQDFYRLSWTADVGVVFDRQVKFRDSPSDFSLDPTALFRIGLWF